MVQRRRQSIVLAVAALLLLAPATAFAAPDTVGLVDPAQGRWYLQAEDGGVLPFYYGNPGDIPFTGDWNCNGVDTPGMFRQSSGFVYLRNTNSQGNADITFFFGNPGDIPIVGDFDDDGCDTVSIYRPSNQTIYIVNELGANGGGLGAAEFSYVFGNPGDKPFTGDFDDDGTDTVGLHRESTGLVYFRNSHTQGNADNQFFYGNPGDRFVAGDWNDNEIDSPGIYRPGNATFYLKHANTQGNADEAFSWGFGSWLPVAGAFDLPSGLPPAPQVPMLELVTSGLTSPIYVTSPPGDDRLFVVQRGGLIRIVENGTLLPTPFLNLSGTVYDDGEAGLLSMAFHPDYASNGRFFVFHSEDPGPGDHVSLVLGFTVSGNPNVANAASRQQVLAVTQPAENHNGGQIEFGPDGYLYIGIGDGGGSNDPNGHGQNTTTLLGSMLRIDVDSGSPYAIPAGNPFASSAGADEIWAYGLRNPWRWTFDGGLLYIADVGQGAREEINVVPQGSAGLNYGWCVWEGTSNHSGSPGCNLALTHTPPVHEYTHGDGCSITGGRVYRNTELPNLVGHYFYGDLCDGWIRSFVYSGGVVSGHRDWSDEFGTFPFTLWSFGSDSAGNVYVVDSSGSIWRIAAN